MSYRAGTPLDLERYLTKEIAVWLTDFRLKSPTDRGALLVPIEVVQGFVPSFYGGPENGYQDKAPVVAVRVTGGSYMRERGKVSANIMILVWDDNLDRKGYQDCMNIMNHLVHHLQFRVQVGHSFVLTDDPIHFMEVVDPFKDFFPYFVAGIEAQFFVPSAQSLPADVLRVRPGVMVGGTEGWDEPESAQLPP